MVNIHHCRNKKDLHTDIIGKSKNKTRHHSATIQKTAQTYTIRNNVD